MPTTILDGETYEQARHRRFTEEAKVIEKMQQDEIIRMAREAGFETKVFNSIDGDEVIVRHNNGSWICISDELDCFATIVAAHEREACAQVCETDELCCKCGDECAAAIRARGEK